MLDFRKISLASQLDRVESGEIELREFDFWYAKHHLARPAYLAMEEMKQQIGDSDPELLNIINKPVRKMAARSLEDTRELWSKMLYRPEPFDVPESLKNTIDSSHFVLSEGDPVMVRVDLDADGQYEYLLLVVHEYGLGFTQFYHLTDRGWNAGGVGHAAWNRKSGEVRDLIKNGDVELVDPRYKHVEIGGVRLKPVTNE